MQRQIIYDKNCTPVLKKQEAREDVDKESLNVYSFFFPYASDFFSVKFVEENKTTMLITRLSNYERKIGICFINVKHSIQTEGLRTNGLLTGTWQVSEA